jgi:hypothetical protein
MWQLQPLVIIPKKFKLLKFISDHFYVRNAHNVTVNNLKMTGSNGG